MAVKHRKRNNETGKGKRNAPSRKLPVRKPHHWHNLKPDFIPVNRETDPIEGLEGFVYLITHKSSEGTLFYIGKKSFWSRITKAVPGRKNRKHTLKESNWRSYTSSSSVVNNMIESLGKDKFEFTILSLCHDKISLAFLETKYMFEFKALERSDCINDNILGKFYKGNLGRYTTKHLT